jgi:D-cysteine desulfhydrase family pyridoxal phosphate-dependent enzyme
VIDHMTTGRLVEALARKPRISLAQLPTPIEEARRLSDRLGVRVFVKRDDLTGLALGGNKVRKLEFLLGDALHAGADTIVTTGGSQSNHARLTAAACRRVGLECFLVLDRGIHPEPQGNLLLDRLFGAKVRIIDSDDPSVARDAMESLAENLRAGGRKPYVIPRGGSVPTGASGYAAFVPELLQQCSQAGVNATYLYLGTGSTGTHAGVLAGLTALAAPLIVQGISVSRTRQEQIPKVQALADGILDHLGLPPGVGEGQVNVDDAYRGPGYGVPTAETLAAIEVAALDEGLILDPVYTGKVMAGLMAHARHSRFTSSDTVVFVHTGGAPALFAYHREIEQALAASA